MSAGPVTAAEVNQVLVQARDLCRRLDPETIGLDEVPAAFDALTQHERLFGGAVLRMSARYEQGDLFTLAD